MGGFKFLSIVGAIRGDDGSVLEDTDTESDIFLLGFKPRFMAGGGISCVSGNNSGLGKFEYMTVEELCDEGEAGTSGKSSASYLKICTIETKMSFIIGFRNSKNVRHKNNSTILINDELRQLTYVKPAVVLGDMSYLNICPSGHITGAALL